MVPPDTALRESRPQPMRPARLSVRIVSIAESLTAPGAVSAWVELHRRFGSLPFGRLFEPAIAYAADEKSREVCRAQVHDAPVEAPQAAEAPDDKAPLDEQPAEDAQPEADPGADSGEERRRGPQQHSSGLMSLHLPMRR